MLKGYQARGRYCDAAESPVLTVVLLLGPMEVSSQPELAAENGDRM